MVNPLTAGESGKSASYLLLVAACIVAFGLSRRIEPLILCSPFLVALVVGLADKKQTGVSARLTLSSRTAFEREPIEMTITIVSELASPLIELMVPLPADARLVEGSNHFTLHIGAGESRTYTCIFSLPTRRKFILSHPIIRTIGSLGFRVEESASGTGASGVETLTIYPAPSHLKSLVNPRHTQVYSGNYRSEVTGEGTEFATVRTLESGDRLSSINWRASARRGSYFVNRYVAERNADVVLFVDTFTDTELYGPKYVDIAARCAASVALQYIRLKNRVALVEFGHYLMMVPPASSVRHWYRILDTLAGTTPQSRSITYDVSRVPKRILPNHSLVIAVTALLSERFDTALIDLKRRGFDVTAVVIDAAPLDNPRNDILTIADSMWRGERASRISRIAGAGIALAMWSEESHLEATLRQLERYRGNIFRR